MLSQVFKSMTSVITGLVSSVVDMASHFEQTEKGLETVLQSSAKGKQLFEDLRKFSFDTTFGVDELASASTQLLNAGVGVKDLNKQLKMLGDVAQGDKNKFAELSSIFSKIMLQGKASAMQLSQFNFRGVPLAKTLKEMGVEGTASAEQIIQALQKLTDEGGQFHNAMDNIIDTIEGKRGFIDDTMKEILVNFGEATGMTDSYKVLLDVVYSILEKVNNALMSINESPILKALLTGVFVTAIMSVVTAIASSLIPKLLEVISKLVTINALKGVFGWITLAVGATAGAISYLSSTTEELEEYQIDATNSTNNLVDALERLKKVSAEDWAKNEIKYESTELSTLQSQVSALESRNRLIKDVQSRFKIPTAQYLLNNKDYETLNNMVFGDNQQYIHRWAESQGIDWRYETLISLEEKYLKYVEKTSVEEQKEVKNNEAKIKLLNEQIDRRKQLLGIATSENEAMELTNSVLSSTSATKLKEVEEEITKLTEALNGKIFVDLQGGKGVKLKGLFKDLYPEMAKEYERAIEKLNQEKKELKIKMYLEGLADWQKVLQKAFNFTDEDILNGAVKTGAIAVDKFKTDTDKQLAHMETFADALGMDSLDVLSKSVDSIQSALNALAESGLWNVDEATIQELVKYLKEKKDTLNEKKETKGVSDAIKKLKTELKELSPYQDMLKSALESTGLDFDKYSKLFDDYINGQGKTDIPEDVKALFTAIIDAVNKNRTIFDELDDTYKELIGNADSLSEVFASVGLGFATTILHSSHDLEAFVQGFQSSGNWIGGVIATVVQALANVCQGLEGFDDAMNPVTYLFSRLSVLIEFLMHIITDIVQIIGSIAKILNTILKVLSPILKLIEALIDALADTIEGIADAFESGASSIFSWVSANDEEVKAKEEEAERLRRLNEEYSALYSAMKEHEEYYLRTKLNLLGDTYKENATKVNDMILTPKGTFSTSPQDTILAMKHPEELMRNGGVSVQINNYSNNEVETSTDDYGNLIVNISRKVAQDYANGSNGWENAYQQRNISMQGKAYSL